MNIKKFFKAVFKGVLLSSVLTLLSLLVLSLVMMNFELSSETYNWIYVAISTVSMVIGTVVAVKINEEKGWLVGLCLAFLYYIIFFLFAGLVGGGVVISSLFFIKLLLALIIGVLAGILGINL